MTCEQVSCEAVTSICIVAEKVLALLEDESRAHDGEPSQVSVRDLQQGSQHQLCGLRPLRDVPPSRRRLHAMVQQG